jgi:transcriptional regulator with XRE-family HTH domain
VTNEGLVEDATTGAMPWLPSLQQIRRSRLLTQTELAELAGVSLVTINRLENERSRQKNVQFSTLKKLARALKVTPAELMAWPEGQEPPEIGA